VDDAGSHVVIGAEGQQPTLWELSSATKVWQAKGGKPNRVGLVDKAHTTAVAFLPAAGGGQQQTDKQPAAGPAGDEQDAQAQGQPAAVARRFIAGSAERQAAAV